MLFRLFFFFLFLAGDCACWNGTEILLFSSRNSWAESRIQCVDPPEAKKKKTFWRRCVVELARLLEMARQLLFVLRPSHKCRSLLVFSNGSRRIAK